ncbi:MAG TPA: hypothetical protein VLN57_21180 [Xanthobacteraceae bacterium]|nr:hypothetical protein [Xanthobacteraceae bacterium]
MSGAIKPAKPAGPPQMPDALAAFSAALALRFPGVEVKRYVLPRIVTQCREVFIRALTSEDIIMAASFADSLMSANEKSSIKLSNAAEERECVRVAIVGFGDAEHLGTDNRGPIWGAVTYRHVNMDGVPLGEINGWPKRMWDAFARYYNDVNGLPIEEFLEGIREAQIVGAFAPPTSGIPASASPGRLAG